MKRRPQLGPWEFVLRVEQHGETDVEVIDGGRIELCGFVESCVATNSHVRAIIERGAVEWTAVEIHALENEARKGLGWRVLAPAAPAAGA
jgi:hypothetical protein